LNQDSEFLNMILPIYVYGATVLTQIAVPIENTTTEIKQLVEDMFETMYFADGVGLAAPQIGKSIRLFVVDVSAAYEDNTGAYKRAFINPTIIERTANQVECSEGCLSVPDIQIDVTRSEGVLIEYRDENFELKTEWFHGFFARAVQHEYDHLDGIVITDKAAPIRKQLLRSKLNRISKGESQTHYRTKVR
jgi:peptide deformylase